MSTPDYSEAELAIIALLRKRKRLTAAELIQLHYAKGKAPLYADQTIRSALVRIKRKSDARSDAFTINVEKEFGCPIVFVYGPRAPQKARLRA